MTWLLILALLIVTPAALYVGGLMERRRWEWLAHEIRMAEARRVLWTDEQDLLGKMAYSRWDREVTQALSILDPRKDTR